MHSAACQFYQDLYSLTPVDPDAITDLLLHLPAVCGLSPSVRDDLLRPFTVADLLDSVNRSPVQSSPGLDSLPYSVLVLLFGHPALSDLICQVYNDALLRATFPAAWMSTCICLLPKKGDLTTLSNWRPIALINTDAKIFTRLLNSRMILVCSDIVNPYQTGFPHGRYIADNAMLVRLVMDHAQRTNSSAIGLLLDQEKAYDRVHPEYLERVLEHWRFPQQIATCINRLFFDIQIRINVNGFLSPAVSQGRGVRQGDPLSPLLFNLAFEPLLQHILHDPLISGYAVDSPFPGLPNLPAAKILAYADDAFVFLKNVADLTRCLHHLSTYSVASNSRINLHKTLAISLSGAPSASWEHVLASNGIHSWHDRTSDRALVYLGFPLHSSVSQGDLFGQQLLAKIKAGCHLHSQRNLSARGRATDLNVLLPSSLWHVLHLIPFPKSFFRALRSICFSFLNHNMLPKLPYTSFLRLRSSGGLALPDPSLQQFSLQFRWILPLFSSAHPSFSFIHPWLLTLLISLCRPSDALLCLFFPALRPMHCFCPRPRTVFSAGPLTPYHVIRPTSGHHAPSPCYFR